MKKFLCALFVLFCSDAAYAQSAGTVTNHAYAIGKGPGVSGYTSLLCASGQLAIGSATDPTCRTMSADATLSAAGVLTLATVNANVGTFGSATQAPQVTLDGKGRATAAVNVTVTPAVGNITGLGTGVSAALGTNVGTAGSFVVNGGALGTPSAGVATNLTGTAPGLTAGTVTTNANLTGPVTSVGNATAIGSNQVTRAMEAQGIARSVIGVAGNAGANVADIQGATANTFLGVNPAGTGIAFQSLRQIISLSMDTVPAAQASTNFTVMLGNATEASVQALCPIAGTFKNLFILSSAPAAGQTLTATWRVNTADTAITCTVTGTGTTCNDTTHTATCTAGQPYSLKLVTSATTGSLASISGGIEFDSP